MSAEDLIAVTDKRDLEETPVIPIDENGKKYKDITKMYKKYMFFLTIGMMFPNPRYDTHRKIVIGCILIYLTPSLVLICNDMRLRILTVDIENLTRQFMTGVSIAFINLKLVLSVIRRKELREIMDVIDKDYESYNNLPDDYQEVIDDTIRRTKRLERIWPIVHGITAASYPLVATISTIISQFSDTPRRYMVHECSMMFTSMETIYKSPYFEFIALYSVTIVTMVFISFTGFDGMFCISILHASLKLKLISQDLKHLMDDDNDLPTIKKKLNNIVKEHIAIQAFINKIQSTFEIWLIGMFCYAVLQIGMSLGQATAKKEGSRAVGTYHVHIAGTTFHIYWPCTLASDVTLNAAEVAISAYSCCWESVQDTGVRKSLALIIHKAQVPIDFKVLGLLTFNMEMFASILRTSYSMYTILRN